ncbi:SDR family oxidoreductase [Roseibium alexandrii]|uniref:Short chain dehydrogenase n=1 Tax=Roseibium alexandrii TaxID=388408 RepID=A0A0M6ZXX1_9HYPH|nr:SDR family oxidoreductase [Roseibium alexandrii]CTQ67539.1 short chain dehydrogenase [Roseibium alexandrii]
MQSLENQRVLILGGSGQMGGATARAVSRLGAVAILAGRSREKLDHAAAGLEGRAETIVVDLSVPGAVADVLSEANADHIVVAMSANASASDIPGTSVAAAQDAFKRFWASYAAVQAAAKLPEHGSVTLLSGSSARTPAAGFGVWSTLHGSIEALARAATPELAPVRVNVVSPGAIGLAPDRQLIPRRGVADDIGQAIAALITNPAITGAVLDVDSGERKGTWSGH